MGTEQVIMKKEKGIRRTKYRTAGKDQSIIRQCAYDVTT